LCKIFQILKIWCTKAGQALYLKTKPENRVEIIIQNGVKKLSPAVLFKIDKIFIEELLPFKDYATELVQNVFTECYSSDLIKLKGRSAESGNFLLSSHRTLFPCNIVTASFLNHSRKRHSITFIEDQKEKPEEKTSLPNYIPDNN
jgi:hypothetical protein